MDDKQNNGVIEELRSSLISQGFDPEAVDTAIAKAVEQIKTREQGGKEEVHHEVRNFQALYGPAPVEEEVYEVRNFQVLYGPAPVEECHEISNGKNGKR